MSEAFVNHTVIGNGYRAINKQDPVSGRELSGAEWAFEAMTFGLEIAGPVGEVLARVSQFVRIGKAAEAIAEAGRATRVANAIEGTEKATEIRRALTGAKELSEMRPVKQVAQAADEVVEDLGSKKHLALSLDEVSYFAKTGSDVIEGNSIGDDLLEVAPSISKKIAAESNEITQESVMRALRQSGTIEGAAIAKLLKRGKLRINIVDELPKTAKLHSDTEAYFITGTDYATLIKSKLKNPNRAAGALAHEGKHWLQNRARISVRSKISEFEAFQWQIRVDRSFILRTENEILDHVNNHPAYKDLKPFGWY